MNNTFDIFLGGPMGSGDDDGAGVSLQDHLLNMSNAVIQIANRINEEVDTQRITVLNPSVEEIGTIKDRVFEMIDRAELGIIDVSTGSPSAMYELTLLHALGIPVIPISLKKPKAPITIPLPFYLRPEYAVMLEDYSQASLEKALEPKIRVAIGLDASVSDHTTNPITNFYGLPLMDVSATTGLATGYFHNFLRFVLKETGSVFDVNDDLEKVVVLVPENLDEVAGMRFAVKNALASKGVAVEDIDEKDGKPRTEAEQVRGQVILFKAGKYLFDIPAPLSAQKSSSRHLRLTRAMENTPAGDRFTDLEIRLERLENAMIDRFFMVLRGLIRRPEINSGRVEFLTVSEFVSRF